MALSWLDVLAHIKFQTFLNFLLNKLNFSVLETGHILAFYSSLYGKGRHPLCNYYAVMASSPVPVVWYEVTDKVPADWSSESSGVQQVDAMVPRVTLTAGRAK